MTVSIPVATQSKAQVCGRSPPEIVVSNTTGGMDACCECSVCQERSLRQADPSSRGLLPTVVRPMSVI